MSTALLQLSAAVTLDGSGNGTASTGPTGFRETWQLGGAGCSVSTNASEAICRFYVGTSATAPYFAGGTTWGSTGDSATWQGGDLPVGQQVWAVWEGGDPGAVATLTVTGTRTVA